MLLCELRSRPRFDSFRAFSLLCIHILYDTDDAGDIIYEARRCIERGDDVHHTMRCSYFTIYADIYSDTDGVLRGKGEPVRLCVYVQRDCPTYYNKVHRNQDGLFNQRPLHIGGLELDRYRDIRVHRSTTWNVPYSWQ
jgi:hypothetical protein